MPRNNRIRGQCTVEGCQRPHKGRGYCLTHYMQYLRGVPITAAIRVRDQTPREHCAEPDCLEPVKARGLCATHYARLLRHGHTRYRDRKRPAKPCSVEGCESHVYANGVCHAHYIRQRGFAEYGVTSVEVAAMLERQGGVCAICRKASTRINGLSRKVTDLDLDHDHATGKVRGLLCSHCNRGIGLLKDDPVILRAAADYIEHHRAGPADQQRQTLQGGDGQ